MGGINLSIHPLFFAFGIYYALTGRIFVFIIYTICAVVHELGHSYVASGLGYKLNKITLMPFGAVVCGNISSLKPIDEIKIAVAGPLVNLATGFFVVACWWMCPQSYPFTDIVAEANFTMALINFIPVYPLDGGRVLGAIISHKYGEEKSFKILRITGLVFSVMLMALFVVSIFHKINLSILFFSLFIIFGAFSKDRENRYIKLVSDENRMALLKRGTKVNLYGVDKDITIKKLIKLLDTSSINEVEIFDKGEKIAYINNEKLNKILERADIYGKLSSYL